MVREAERKDLNELLAIYTQLGDNKMPESSSKLDELWNKILSDKDYHIVVYEDDGRIVSSCVCVIIPNLTHDQRPYAFVENVVTDKEHRKKGLATKCLNFAKEIAEKNHCYKMMLLTGSKKESTLNFYRKAGYNSNDKTAFIQWLY